jgi:RimJ/RimL family protein N-acetyltransferase
VPTLETKRLVLREWKDSDVDDLVEGLDNLEVAKWLASVPNPYTRRDAEGFIAYCQSEPTGCLYFAIELKSENKVIGGVSIERINDYHGTAGGGIWIGEKYHGHGYGTEAFGKRIEYAFTTLNLRRLENGFFEGNPSSQIMQERLGYVVEGKRRKGFLCRADGEYKDEIITGLLKEEWKAYV